MAQDELNEVVTIDTEEDEGLSPGASQHEGAGRGGRGRKEIEEGWLAREAGSEICTLEGKVSQEKFFRGKVWPDAAAGSGRLRIKTWLL